MQIWTRAILFPAGSISVYGYCYGKINEPICSAEERQRIKEMRKLRYWYMYVKVVILIFDSMICAGKVFNFASWMRRFWLILRAWLRITNNLLILQEFDGRWLAVTTLVMIVSVLIMAYCASQINPILTDYTR